jgi:haloalkane dehalogenase
MLAFSDSDPVTKRGERAFLSGIPACAGSSNQTVVGAGHFLQEDAGLELANMVHEFIDSHPV